MTRIGVISDTHGLLRPEAVAALAGVSHIVHAGDVGTPEVLEELRKIAPVTAVRGNNDRGPWAQQLAVSESLRVAGHVIYVLHDIAELEIDAAAKGYAAVITGHSHKPVIEKRGGVLFLNPGSAGPRRFSLPISVAVLDVHADGVRARIQELKVAKKRSR